MKLDLTTEPADSFADIRLFQNIGKFHPLPLIPVNLPSSLAPPPRDPACLKTTPAV
jgi:hypothetical protein